MRAAVSKYLSAWRRGLASEDEAANDVLCALVPPSHIGVPVPASTVRLMQEFEVPAGVLVYMWDAACAEGRALMTGPVRELVRRAVQAGPDVEWDVTELACLLARDGLLPREVEEAVRDAPPNTWRSRTELVLAIAAGDVERATALARDGLVDGSVAALEYAAMPDPARAPRASIVRDVLADVAPGRYLEGQDESVARVACLLAGTGAFSQAAAWSARVDDGSGPLLGPLAVISYLAGDEEQARRQASAWSPGVDTAGWWTAGSAALAHWTSARLAPRSERRPALLAIEPRHTDLGLLRAQIEADLAELAQADGDAEARRAHVLARDAAAAQPVLRLHLGRFDYQALLYGLPVAQGPAT